MGLIVFVFDDLIWFWVISRRFFFGNYVFFDCPSFFFGGGAYII